MASKTEWPKILCVDDEPGVLESLTRVLRSDFSVLTAPNGQLGLETLKANDDCAVILTDFRMPKMNGIEFLQAARQIAPNAVRAVLSGQMDLQQVTDAINKAEIHRLILKPWDNDYLRVQMLEALQAHGTLVERSWLHKQAITDPVTQLTNHRYFQEQLRELLLEVEANNNVLSIIMIDVDHFKNFNDQYGHPEGDRLLAAVADRIQSNVPTSCTVSRYGGEEFVILAPLIDTDQAAEMAQKLRLSLEKLPFTGPFERPAYITISLGVATYPYHAITPAQLVEAADRALYQAKRQGRNQAVVSSRP